MREGATLTPELERVQPGGEPSPNTPTSEGCGEHVTWHDTLYYAAAGRRISRSKPTWVTWEGNWCGRVRGDKDYLIVAWNGEDFTVLENVSEGLRTASQKYQGLTCEQAIDKAKERLAEQVRQRAEWEALLRPCPECGEKSSDMIFDDVCRKCSGKGVG